MFKKLAAAAIALFCVQQAYATIDVTVENRSRNSDVFLIQADQQVTDYIPFPERRLGSGENDIFVAYGYFSSTAQVVDLKYGATSRPSGPRCHFRYTTIRDYRTGELVPSKVIAKSEGGSYRDRMECRGRLTSFDLWTGDASVEFTIERKRW